MERTRKPKNEQASNTLIGQNKRQLVELQKVDTFSFSGKLDITRSITQIAKNLKTIQNSDKAKYDGADVYYSSSIQVSIYPDLLDPIDVFLTAKQTELILKILGIIKHGNNISDEKTNFSDEEESEGDDSVNRGRSSEISGQ